MKPGVLVFLAGPVFPTDVRNLRCSELGGLRCTQFLNLTIEGHKTNNHGPKFLVVRTAPKPMFFSRVGTGKSRVWHRFGTG